MSSIYFYSDDDGEFWYSLKLEVNDAPENTLAPLTSPIGKFAITSILLENPLEKNSNIRVENSNPISFHIISKKIIQLLPLEKRKIELRYIPTCVGIKENAEIAFRSNETGDWIYKISGIGKPPQPLSPIIVSATSRSPNSALVLFTNPYPFPSKFNVSLSSEHDNEIFKFLLKRKTFTLTSYGEEFQIPFTFSPNEIGQYQAHIIVSSLGPIKNIIDQNSIPDVRWMFPIIGNCIITQINESPILKCKSHESIEEKLIFNLIGETEIFNESEYLLFIHLPVEFEYLRNILDFKPIKISKNSTSTEIIVLSKLSPKRPAQLQFGLTISNPLHQEWNFTIEIIIERGKPISTLIIESLLNKTGIINVTLPFNIRTQTPFHAYFANGSATEFMVSIEHGFIEPSNLDEAILPFNILFNPKMYGKVLKGLLVIDTLDSQFLFEIIGKTPEYIPPNIKNGTLLIDLPINEENNLKKKRNIIKDNIENIKNFKPKIISPNSIKKSFH